MYKLEENSLETVNWVEIFMKWLGLVIFELEFPKTEKIKASNLQESNKILVITVLFPVLSFPTPPPRNSLFVEDIPCGQRQLKATKTKKDYVEVNGEKQLLLRNLR